MDVSVERGREISEALSYGGDTPPRAIVLGLAAAAGESQLQVAWVWRESTPSQTTWHVCALLSDDTLAAGSMSVPSPSWDFDTNDFLSRTVDPSGSIIVRNLAEVTSVEVAQIRTVDPIPNRQPWVVAAQWTIKWRDGSCLVLDSTSHARPKDVGRIDQIIAAVREAIAKRP